MHNHSLSYQNSGLGNLKIDSKSHNYFYCLLYKALTKI